jgi:hypothetical protein
MQWDKLGERLRINFKINGEITPHYHQGVFMVQNDLDNIRVFIDKNYKTHLPSTKQTYEAALKRYVSTGEIKKGFRPMSLFRDYINFCESLVKDSITISNEDMRNYIYSFVDTLDISPKSKITYRSGLYYYQCHGTFGNYRVSTRLWNELIKFIEFNFSKKEVEPKAKITTPEIPIISKDVFDKKAKLFLDSYKVMNKSLYKEIKADILNFIRKYLYGNYEKDCIRLESLTSQQKEIYEQYKTVIQDFMNTYKPVQGIPQAEKDFTVKVQSIQTQIKSLTSVIDSLKNELVRLSTELETILN